ncbi:MAG: NAD-dependent deacylase [Candidatus Cybelea sp.]
MFDDAVAAIRRANALFALSGSGISAESGLPTFRGTGGLWRTHRVEELASSDGFERDPALVWRWYNERKTAHEGAQPNAGHTALAQLEDTIGEFTLATQNVDSLHRRAGSRHVLELHGSLREARCTRCEARRPLGAAGLPLDEIDHTCGGRWRPDIVWFGESLPPETWRLAKAAAARADVILVIGTSAVVYPAAALATAYNARAYVIEVNPERTPISERAHCVLHGSATELLPSLTKAACRGAR